MKMGQIVNRVPVMGSIVAGAYRQWLKLTFPGSRAYWEQRYASGGDSGDGSRRRLAVFKAGIINDFVRNNDIRTVIEYGCGDGYQLQLADYPAYIGFDVSRNVITQCEEIFAGDTTKSFKLAEAYNGETADVTLSLDVIFHLVENSVFNDYMERLFDSSLRFVIIYSSDTEVSPDLQGAHVRHRQFSSWVACNRKEWQLCAHIPNRYPYRGDTQEGSFCDFYIYERIKLPDLPDRFGNRLSSP